MNYVVPAEVAVANRRFHILASTTHFNPRVLVIQSVCELEYLCGQILYRFFVAQGCKKSWETTHEELFAESGLLSSLTRMTKIASYLNLLSPSEVADLRVFAHLRNRYAHGHQRNEFNDDEAAGKQLRKLVLFKNSPSLEKHDNQGIFICCFKILAERLKQRAEASAGAA